MISLEKHKITLVVLLLIVFITYFLPWFTVEVSLNGQAYTETVYGCYYIIPMVAPYSVPTGILCVTGFILSIISLKRTRRFLSFNVAGGILILAGVIISFLYTFIAISSKIPFNSISWSINVWAEYGAGLMFLSGLLIAVIGAFQKLYGALKGLYIEMGPLVKISVCGLGVSCLIIGIALIGLGIYGLAGGTGITFTINERVVTAQEGGQIFSIIGTAISLIGIALSYIGFKRVK